MSLKFWFTLEKNAIETFKILGQLFGEQTAGNNAGSRVVTQDHKLCQLCSGYPLTGSTNENVYRGKELVLKKQNITICAAADVGNFILVILEH